MNIRSNIVILLCLAFILFADAKNKKHSHRKAKKSKKTTTISMSSTTINALKDFTELPSTVSSATVSPVSVIQLTTGNSSEIHPHVTKTCKSLNSSCEICVNNAKCFFCYTGNHCLPYPANSLFPTKKDCPPDLGHARWGTCLVNFKALLISAGVLSAILLVACPCFFCCCCYRKKSRRAAIRLELEQAKWRQDDEQISQKHAEKRAQRQKMYDSIRKKYGLVGDGNNHYKRLNNA